MTKTITLKGMAGVEHAQPDHTFRTYLPEDPVPMPIKAGDRLRVRLETSGDAWIYAVAVIRQATYWKLGAWPPDRGASTGDRTLWPGGLVMSADDAKLMSLIVVASSQELPWLRDLERADCSALVGQEPPASPTKPCDHLYGLFWKIQMQPRGLVPPTVDFIQDGTVRVPAIVVENADAPYTALEWQFNLRT